MLPIAGPGESRNVGEMLSLFLEHVLATYPIERVGEFHVATQFVLSAWSRQRTKRTSCSVHPAIPTPRRDGAIRDAREQFRQDPYGAVWRDVLVAC